MKHIAIYLIVLFPLLCHAQLKNVVLEDKAIPKPFFADPKVLAWDTTQNGFLKLSKEGKDFYYWTNYSRQNPKRFWDSVVLPILETFPSLQSSYSESLKKDLYGQPELPLFKLNGKLMLTAQSHATDIGSHQAKPGHVSTDGRNFSDRIRAAGIRDCGGENVSLGDVDPILSLVLLYIDYGIPTLGHRKALLNPSYIETGIGVCVYGATDNLFIVQDFSCPQN